LKKILPLFLFFVLLLFFILSAGMVWVLKTTAGTVWLMDQISVRSGTGIGSGQVHGNLWDGVRLVNLEISWDQGTAQIEDAQFRWQPLAILKGEVSIKDLSLEGVSIQDNRPEEPKPLELIWPDLPGLPIGFSIELDALRVEDFVYRRLDEIRLQAESFYSHIAVRGGKWTFTDMELKAPFGTAEGNLAAGLPRPSLDMDISITLKDPAGEINRIALITKFRSSGDERLLSGGMDLSAFAGSKPRLNAAAEISIRKDNVEIVSSRLVQPGRKGEVSLKGDISLREDDVLLRLSAGLTGVDLSPEISFSTDLSGSLDFTGNPEKYRGSFALANRDKEWRAAALSGTFTGTKDKILLDIKKGNWLEGTLTGNLEVDWKEALKVSGALEGKSLNPALFEPEWKGIVNLHLKGDLQRPEKGPLKAKFSARLDESMFRGQSLRGSLDGRLEGENIEIGRLFLQGMGFHFEASGDLRNRIVYKANVTDISGLVPAAEGRFSADGWVRRRNELFSGTAEGKGQALSYDGIKMKSVIFSGQVSDTKGNPLNLKFSAAGVEINKIIADSLAVNAEGIKGSHTMRISATSGKSGLQTSLKGGYQEGVWRGSISQLSGRDPVGPWKLRSPAALEIASGKVVLSQAVLAGVPGEQIEMSANISTDPILGTVSADWKNLNLDRVSVWLKDLALKGKSSGSMDLNLLSGERMNISARARASGELRTGEYVIPVREFVVDLKWDQAGLRAAVDLGLKTGSMNGLLTSSTPARMAVPEQGEIDVNWKNFDLAFFRRWIPPEFNVEGRLSGNLTGNLLSGKRFTAKGSAGVTGGGLSWKTRQRLLHASVEAASLSFGWQNKTISGDFSLALREYGKLSGSYRLPVAAAFPVTFDRQSPIDIAMKGNVRESGLVSSFFPGLVQESSGDLALDLRISGTAEEPEPSGSLRLKNAAAYLPSTGIHLKGLSVSANLEKNRIVIDTFQVSSGKGTLTGKAAVAIKEWNIISYQGEVSGRDFQTIYLPDLRVWSSPDLKFEGTPEKISVSGDVRIPELLVREDEAEPVIEPSSDVVIVDSPTPEQREEPLALNVRVKLILGEKVFVRAEGIDAKLGGNIALHMRSLDNVTGEGEIKVEKGTYKRFGVNLDITRGRFFFAGGRIGNPAIDILAVRKIGEVRAGVVVTGNFSSPVVELYSEPGMPDTDVLAYIVLGHPLGQSGEQAGLMMRAAGLLLSSTQAASVQEQIRGRLGLDVLQIEAGETEAGVVSSMVTVGKYLSPRLFISYGRSLFTESDLFRLRYTISRRWEVETRSGDESGIDLYYKIDFK
jgi:translocation and assembly module TamB